jgi:hypothetical protein
LRLMGPAFPAAVRQKWTGRANAANILA